MRDAALVLASVLVPVVVAAAGTGAIRAGQVRFGLMVAFAGLGFGVFAAAMRARASGLTPYAITSGELRDRVFELAARSGVTLRQLYVVPFRRFRMPNAFAVQGGVVTLTDLLLRELDRDEVDAILAHEMAHLARRDPDKLARFMVAHVAASSVAAFTFGFVAGIAVLVAGLLAQFAYQRRIEHATDARALDLGIRPEALITGLGRLHQVARMPVRWYRGQGLLLTHPSLEMRATRIAGRAGIAPEVARSWLDELPEPGARYAIPAAVDAPRHFGSTFRRQVVARLSWSLLGAVALVPAATIAALAPFDLVPRIAAITIAAIAGWGAWVLLAALGSQAPMRSVERALRAALDRQDHRAHCFVGLAPGSTPRLFEGFAEWDAGFMTLAPGRLDFRGEEATFSLSPPEVCDLRVDAGLPGWAPIHAVRIAWRTAEGAEGAFGFVPSRAATASRRGATRVTCSPRSSAGAPAVAPPASGRALLRRTR